VVDQIELKLALEIGGVRYRQIDLLYQSGEEEDLWLLGDAQFRN
jgi:hypothetical protein